MTAITVFIRSDGASSIADRERIIRLQEEVTQFHRKKGEVGKKLFAWVWLRLLCFC
jgi:hypothetical protein